MEVSYLIIPLVKGGENTFNQELTKLFPFGKMKVINVHNQLLLTLYFDIDNLLNVGICNEEQLLQTEEIIHSFSRKHPYLKLLYLHITGGSVCFYEGYLLKNRNKLMEKSGLEDSYLPLIQALVPVYEERTFEPFLSAFVSES